MDHFTLSGDEAGWLRNKSGATRLGFAVQLKFLTWRGRFPKTRLELPGDAVEHVAKQAGVAASQLEFYDFTDRTAQRHRTELRKLTGWHECSKTDTLKLVSHLVDAIWHDERREEQARAELFRQMRHELIEPPTPDQVTSIIRSALHQADERAVAEVAARLAREEDCPRRLDALVFTDPTDDAATADQEEAAAVDGDSTEEDEDEIESVLSDIKAHPGIQGGVALEGAGDGGQVPPRVRGRLGGDEDAGEQKGLLTEETGVYGAGQVAAGGLRRPMQLL